ncbi:dehydrogenase [Thermocladium modestius]|uniref:Dehydrogenase n=1 Tax=Thermocladium modestius TaxID=62609 RepID=A0A830GRC8_9CREN|nr:NAD(P)/FAD-dependent oxidoreductase [Thermocladium modestius]GGP19418.1 dehydrogenase [Thermocladium modestius]
MRIGVAGAGPSSLYLLRITKNHDITAFEEDPKLGLPRHCTGLVSINGAIGLGIYRREIVIGRYSRVRIINGEDGAAVEFRLPRHSIIMLDRPGLEESLYEGVGVEFGRRVKEATRGGSLIDGEGAHGFDAAIIGEGARGRLSRALGMRGEYLFGIQGDGRGRGSGDAFPSSTDEIAVIFDRRISPSYFSWLVPLGEGEYRAGVVDEPGRVASSLNYFMKRFNIHYRRKFGGNVMVSSSGYIAAGRLAAIGDSTGLNKALTGGGILTGVLSARLLGEALNSAQDPASALRAYAKALYSAIGGTLKLYSTVASLLYLRNGIEAVLEVLDSVGGLSIEVDDYDNHAKAVAAILRRRPSLILTLLRLLPRLDLGPPTDAVKLLLNAAYAVNN